MPGFFGVHENEGKISISEARLLYVSYLILQVMLLLLPLLGAAIYSMVEEERSKGYTRGYDRFRLTVAGAVALTILLWTYLGKTGTWIIILSNWALLFYLLKK